MRFLEQEFGNNYAILKTRSHLRIYTPHTKTRTRVARVVVCDHMESVIVVWYVVLCGDYKTCAVCNVQIDRVSRLLAGTRGAISLVSREKGGQRKFTWLPRIKTSDLSLCSSVGANCSSLATSTPVVSRSPFNCTAPTFAFAPIF